MLELKGISKRFGSTIAVRPIDLTIASGRTTALIGPSGCGKSTLLRLMIGLVKPDTGTILVDNSILGDENLEEIRRKIGYVIQDGGLFPHLTAEGNACLVARHLGWGTERVRERLRELSRLTKFPEEALGRYPSQLSGGQRQRVGLIRALMLDPGLLLLDEPMGALDPMIRSELQEDLKHIFKSLGKTVVLVTHDLAEAAFLGDTLVLLRRGEVVQSGSVRELAESPKHPFVTEYIHAQRSFVIDSPR